MTTQLRPLPSLLALACSVSLSCAGAATASAGVDVFPVPGARVAAPQTQITFRGIPAGRIGIVSAVGSRSGSHRGRLAPDSDGNGASFIPIRPFTPGEYVTVTAGVALAGGASHSYSFAIAHPARPLPRSTLPLMTPTGGDVQHFQSRPGLTPPAVGGVRASPGASTGDLFLGNQNGPLQDGPMVLDGSGKLVWFKPLPRYTSATDVRVQTWNGARVLTWWQGNVTAGVGNGIDLINDPAYHVIATVRAGNGLRTDLHEFALTPAGTALITAYYPVYWDARSVHGSRHTAVLDSVVQEIDVRTGLVLFQWDSLDHVPLTDSESKYSRQNPRPYDYFHINSIDLRYDGSLVLSGRNTSAGYDIDHHTGVIHWILGGRSSSFTMGSGAQFAWQHDIRMRSPAQVTVFDDGAGDTAAHRQSRGLSLILDFRRRTATRVQEFAHSPRLLAYYEGNAQLLANGDLMVGWGQQPYFTEFDPHGHTVFDARFVDANSSYRVYRMPWTGTPRTRPSVAAHPGSRITAVYASWNGATDVSAWRVLGGASPSRLSRVGTTARRGFETRIVVRPARYVAVQALGAAGQVMSQSATVRARAS